jgi:hypothetical protein
MSTIPIEVKLPTISQAEPKTIHFRVLIHAEVDQDIPDNVDKSALAILVAKDIKSKYPTLKITKVLTAEGIGPVAEPL